MIEDGAGPLLNISALAKRLKVSRATVHNWLNAGTCPVTPVPNSKPPKFRKADVDALDGVTQ